MVRRVPDATRRRFIFKPWVTASIDSDEKTALQDAKPWLAFYSGFSQYSPYFEAHGFGAEARKIAEASQTMNCVQAAPIRAR